MLETLLVSSRIRRALLEYTLTHARDRFYLRGLAKELGLSVSPLRRELKRLEQLGLLSASEEGNMLFYTVNERCPLFAQLKQALLSVPMPQPAAPVAPEVLVASTVVSAKTVDRMRRAMHRPMRWPMLIGVVAVGLVAMVLVVDMAYLTVTNQQLMSLSHRAVSTSAQVTVVEQRSGGSGAMSGSRWRLVPGAIGGGFSAPSQNGKESY